MICCGRNRRQQVGEQPAQHAVEQRRLVAHVRVQRHRRHPGALGHGPHRHRAQALLVGQGQRRVQNLLPSVRHDSTV